METITLNEIKPKQKCRIVKVNVIGALKKRLLEMGIIRGVVVEVKRVAPLGDPIDIKVKGYNLSLRREEAKGIIVERS